MTATTPSPAHVALVATFQNATFAYVGAAEVGGQVMLDAARHMDASGKAVIDALAAPVPNQNQLLRKFLDAAGGEGLVLDGVDAGDLYVSMYGYEPAPESDAGAQQPTPAARLDNATQYCVNCATHVTAPCNSVMCPIEDNQVMQPVEAPQPKDATEIQRFIGSNFGSTTYANGYGGAPSDDDRYELTAHDLLTCFREWSRYEIPVKVAVAAPVAPIEPNKIIALAEKCSAEVGRYEGRVVWVKFHEWFEREFPVANGTRERYRVTAVMDLMFEAWAGGQVRAALAAPADHSAEIVSVYEKLHADKIGAHWLWCVIEQIAAGVPEPEAFREFGYYDPATEHNFCARCGQRSGAAGHIHTCTPPLAGPVEQGEQG